MRKCKIFDNRADGALYVILREQKTSSKVEAKEVAKLMNGDDWTEYLENVKDVNTTSQIDKRIYRKQKGVAACLSKGGRQGDGA